MATGKKLGIWMDHSNAHLIEFTDGRAEEKIISSKFTRQEKEHGLSKGENLMHHQEQHQQAAYYKKLGEVMKHYSRVVLFGPTDSKAELFNSLKDDHLFSKIKIEVEQADKMSKNQRGAFVKKHFSKH